MSRNTPHYRIVLADDDEDDRTFFREAISQLRYSSMLHICNDGERLLNYLSGLEYEMLPDIIFLDLHMPKKDGIQCIREIRQMPQFTNIPIVMFTILGEAPYTKDPDSPKANRYIEKTGSFIALMQTLDGLLSEEGYNTLIHRQDASC